MRDDDGEPRRLGVNYGLVFVGLIAQGYDGFVGHVVAPALVQDLLGFIPFDGQRFVWSPRNAGDDLQDRAIARVLNRLRWLSVASIEDYRGRSNSGVLRRCFVLHDPRSGLLASA